MQSAFGVEHGEEVTKAFFKPVKPPTMNTANQAGKKVRAGAQKATAGFSSAIRGVPNASMRSIGSGMGNRTSALGGSLQSGAQRQMGAGNQRRGTLLNQLGAGMNRAGSGMQARPGLTGGTALGAGAAGGGYSAYRQGQKNQRRKF